MITVNSGASGGRSNAPIAAINRNFGFEVACHARQPLAQSRRRGGVAQTTALDSARTRALDVNLRFISII